MRAIVALSLILSGWLGCAESDLEAAGVEQTAATETAEASDRVDPGAEPTPALDETPARTPEPDGSERVNPTPPVDEPPEPEAPSVLSLSTCETDSEAAVWTAEERLAAGPHLVGKRELLLIDPDRTTMKNGIFPELPSRTLRVAVWYPAKKGLLGDFTPSLNAELNRDDGPYPLVIHAHGFMSDRTEVTYVGEHLASHGYVVVAPDFPLSNMLAAGGPTILDVPNQPGDVSFLIDHFVGAAMTSNSPFYKGVDPDRIVMSGTSLGGLTTYLSTYHPDLRDDRILAAVTLAGPSFMFTETFWGHADVPMLLVHGDIDAIIGYDDNAVATLGRAAPNAGLVTLLGGSHTGFASAAALLGFAQNPDEVGCQAIAGNISDDPGALLSFVDPELGIIDAEAPAMCTENPLPPAMAVADQHDITKLSIHAFFDLVLAADEGTRAAACGFLNQGLEADYPELADVAAE